MNILDLDDDTTWVETYKTFIKEDPFSIVIDDALSQKTGNKICKILEILSTNSECLELEEHLLFHQRCTDMFKRTYTDVVAYHACRPTNVQRYYDEGIIPSDPEKLIGEAKSFFKDFKDIGTVIATFDECQGQQYLNYGRNTVGFFLSRADASKNNQFLKYGSELFYAIASRLREKEVALQKLSDQGTPTLIICRLPVSWLDKFTTRPQLHRYALSSPIQLLEQLVRLRWPERDDSFRGDFLLNRSLPKEQILDHIEMNE